MNEKKAKKLRKQVDYKDHQFAEIKENRKKKTYGSMYVWTNTIFLHPECGRAMYQKMKKWSKGR